LPTRHGIPEEILQFFASPGGHSMIVKGYAGTGKTTFALQLTEELGEVQHSYYMSTRVSDTSLYHQFPWLRERVGGSVAGGEALEVARESYRARKVAEAKADRKVDRTELRKLEGRIEMGEEGGEEYEKVGEGEVVDSGLVFDLGSDLPEIDMAYDVVERNLPAKTLLLIDSIDALSERYGLVPSKLINTLQRDLVESSGANVLYVFETSGATRLDFLGDGVVSLATETYSDRRLRVMTIEKLRGTEIMQPRYLYTLSGGRLTAFPLETAAGPKKPKRWEPVPDLAEDVVSTGNEVLDALFGGLRRGRFYSFEVGANVPSEYMDYLRTAVVCNFATLGRGVAYVPARKATADIVRDGILPYIGEAAFDDHVRVFEIATLGSLESGKNALHMEGANVDTDLKWSNVEYHLPKAKHPFLSFASFDTLESVYGANALEEMTGHLSAVRRGGDIFVGVSNPMTASNEKLANLAHVHVRVENLGGTIILYGEKPHTGLYRMGFDVQSGRPKVTLAPIL
jgi:KaiC/GvpD/RAD55 family RecA-like ATPase